MRTASPRSDTARFAVVIVTTDERVSPEAETYLAPDYDLRVLQTWDELLTLIKREPADAIFLDIDTVGEHSKDGIAALAELRALEPDLVLVGLTRSNSHNLRLQAVSATADEYFVAPINFEEVRGVLRRALEKRALEIECRQRQSEQTQQESFCELIGGSEVMRNVYDAITRVAESTSTVLIRGESGTGKELVARAIVALGPRAQRPFVSLNCSALPENLIETELFGHEKGAFTDARTARAGHIELANTGTLLLDEIATLGLALQSKLLRVLEDRVVTRIGGQNARKIDFRLIAATNEDLEETGSSRPFPRRPLLPHQRCAHRAAGAARPAGGCPSAVGPFPALLLRLEPRSSEALGSGCHADSGGRCLAGQCARTGKPGAAAGAHGGWAGDQGPASAAAASVQQHDQPGSSADSRSWGQLR